MGKELLMRSILILVSVLFFSFFIYHMIPYYKNIHFTCDEYQCHYQEIDAGCQVTILSNNYTCMHISCPGKNSEQATIKMCYTPRNVLECPRNKCYNKEFADQIVTLFFGSLSIIGLFVFIIYNIYQIWSYIMIRKNASNIINLDTIYPQIYQSDTSSTFELL